MELINALPGYCLNAASITSTWEESIHSGKFTFCDTCATTSSSISFSSIPFIPMLISRISAPLSSWFSAISITRSSCPFRSSSCSFFFPVGLIRSPITIKVPFSDNSIVFRSEESRDLLFAVIAQTGSSFTACFNAAICSGVVPQQPPTICAPALTSIFPASANSSGVIL